ncbi:MAG: AMP-binding protein [Mycobacteriales bacterium]
MSDNPLSRVVTKVGDVVGGMAGGRVGTVAGGVINAVESLRVLTEAGLAKPVRPDHLVSMGLAAVRWGATPAAGYAAAAIRYPESSAVIDEAGEVSFRELDRRTNAIANGLAAEGVRAGDVVGLLARNSRAFVEASVALSKVGADILYLNTGFAGPQLSEVLERENATAIVYDAEFAGLLDQQAKDRLRIIAAADPDGGSDEVEGGAVSVDALAEGDDTAPPKPAERGRQIVLTSGTTGTPKGAPRDEPHGIEPAVALLSKIPIKARETTVIAAPLFHTWGMAHWGLALVLSSTVVLRTHFDPEETLAAIADHGATALVVVPVMMQRLMELPEQTRKNYDLSSLRVVAVSGSALPGDLACSFMDAFGDVVYNLYGSTEAAYASVATPEDLRSAPGTSGHPPRGTVIRLVGEDGEDVPTGKTGRIFVGNSMLFDGYTGGEDKERLDGLIATGDMGRFDEQGRLFVEGRDDEMVVSGGENVFPAEVEDVLSGHPGVSDVAVTGVEDEKMGARLAAYVVAAGGKKPTEDELKEHVKSRLARFKVPRDVRFVDELPRNASGKVVKRELAADADADADAADADDAADAAD